MTDKAEKIPVLNKRILSSRLPEFRGLAQTRHSPSAQDRPGRKQGTEKITSNSENCSVPAEGLSFSLHSCPQGYVSHLTKDLRGTPVTICRNSRPVTENFLNGILADTLSGSHNGFAFPRNGTRTRTTIIAVTSHDTQWPISETRYSQYSQWSSNQCDSKVIR